MNRKSNVSLGPGASSLILIFVVLSMAILGMLSLMTSQNDLRLSERNVQVTEAVYTLNAQAERRRAEIDEILIRCAAQTGNEEAYLTMAGEAMPEDVILEDHVISWYESDGGRTLDCALEISPLGERERTAWIRYDLTAETEDAWNW